MPGNLTETNYTCDLLFSDSYISPCEDSNIVSSPGSSYLKRKRSADLQLYQKEKSPKIRETDYPKSPSKENSTNTASPSKQGSNKNNSKGVLDLYLMLKKFRIDPKCLRYSIHVFPPSSY